MGCERVRLEALLTCGPVNRQGFFGVIDEQGRNLFDCIDLGRWYCGGLRRHVLHGNRAKPNAREGKVRTRPRSSTGAADIPKLFTLTLGGHPKPAINGHLKTGN